MCVKKETYKVFCRYIQIHYSVRDIGVWVHICVCMDMQ